MEQLIQQLANLKSDKKPFSIERGISGVDITKPIPLHNILFRKGKRGIVDANTSGELPFEICHNLEQPDCYAYKETYTALGIILLELLFSNNHYAQCTIPHKNSEIQQLFFYLDRETHNIRGLHKESLERYGAYCYSPNILEKYPVRAEIDSEEQLSTFLYGWSESIAGQYGDAPVMKADQLIVSLTVESLIWLAQLFLDIGNTYNTQTEICLENPLYGVGGVSATSIEIRFWLPGSFAFYTDNINDLQF